MGMIRVTCLGVGLTLLLAACTAQAVNRAPTAKKPVLAGTGLPVQAVPGPLAGSKAPVTPGGTTVPPLGNSLSTPLPGSPTPLPSGYASPLPSTAFPSPSSAPVDPNASPTPTPSPLPSVLTEAMVEENTLPAGAGRIGGVVVDVVHGTKPIGGARILIALKMDPAQHAFLINADDGTFVLSGMAAGTYYVTVTKTGYAADPKPAEVTLSAASMALGSVNLVVSKLD